MTKSLETHRRPKRKAAPPSVRLPGDESAAARLPVKRPPMIGDGHTEVSAEERRRMIELAAYYRAERRGFSWGSPEEDWLEAEAEVDRALAEPRLL